VPNRFIWTHASIRSLTISSEKIFNMEEKSLLTRSFASTHYIELLWMLLDLEITYTVPDTEKLRSSRSQYLQGTTNIVIAPTPVQLGRGREGTMLARS
jgi:hypothetical protein